MAELVVDLTEEATGYELVLRGGLSDEDGLAVLGEFEPVRSPGVSSEFAPSRAEVELSVERPRSGGAHDDLLFSGTVNGFYGGARPTYRPEATSRFLTLKTALSPRYRTARETRRRPAAPSA